MKQYNQLNVILGWVVFALSALVYLLTVEPTTSFWDCGEFITTSTLLEVGHPPGAPVFMLIGRLFVTLGGQTNAALMVNIMSALASAFTCLFLFWTITHLAKKVVATGQEITQGQGFAILGSGLVGALGYAFTDTFWFSAVEGEVYAMSSFLTAFVFWAILKWENEADEPRANRWLVLIAYVMGLSIGVHLLNLLAIPAIVFVYYFKKYTPTVKGFIKTLIVSVIILAGILYGIIPGFVKIASWFELLFVNVFGLPFHSGALFYIVAVAALVVWAILFTYRKRLIIWNTIVTCVVVILISYSAFGLIIIRSSAQPIMDQNSPNNMFSLLQYLNREQYGERPLLYGPYYNSPPVAIKETGAVYIRKDGKYVVSQIKNRYVYDSKFETVFPRMWSDQRSHTADYEAWGEVKGRKIRHTNPRGETAVLAKPTFAENMRYFFRYQVGHMYIRYFMWNFAGRQDDIQSHGGILHGNWISGINAIDSYRLGDQKNLPAELADNKAKNKYYFLPLIFGLLGIFYQFNKGREGRRGLWLVSLLFLMTGLAIIIYLNQAPMQPRERDYAYAGSFYAFAIWIGLGVAALYEAFLKLKSEKTRAILATTLGLLAVPVIFLVENYDDHNRAHRYTARDFGANYLETVAENGIIFTSGDNVTYPLWYNQDIESVRRDVRVCNLDYLNTDWYISQMKRPAWESKPLPVSLTEDKYVQGTRDYIYVRDDSRLRRTTIELKDAVDFVASNDTASKLPEYGNADYLPKKSLILTVDKEAVIRNNVVRPEDYDKIADTIHFDFSDRDVITKNELIVLDIIANNNWERPVYFATSMSADRYMGIQDYLQLEGVAYRFVPIKNENEAKRAIDYGRVASDIMYANLTEKYKWGNMNDPRVYIDENNAGMMAGIRNKFSRLAEQLVAEGDNEKAIEMVNKGLELVPTGIVPMDVFSISMINTLYRAGDRQGANKLANDTCNAHQEMLAYYASLPKHFLGSGDVVSDVNYRLIYQLQPIYRYAQNNGDDEMADKIYNIIEDYYIRFNS